MGPILAAFLTSAAASAGSKIIEGDQKEPFAFDPQPLSRERQNYFEMFSSSQRPEGLELEYMPTDLADDPILKAYLGFL